MRPPEVPKGRPPVSVACANSDGGTVASAAVASRALQRLMPLRVADQVLVAVMTMVADL